VRDQTLAGGDQRRPYKRPKRRGRARATRALSSTDRSCAIKRSWAATSAAPTNGQSVGVALARPAPCPRRIEREPSNARGRRPAPPLQTAKVQGSRSRDPRLVLDGSNGSHRTLAGGDQRRPYKRPKRRGRARAACALSSTDRSCVIERSRAATSAAPTNGQRVGVALARPAPCPRRIGRASSNARGRRPAPPLQTAKA